MLVLEARPDPERIASRLFMTIQIVGELQNQFKALDLDGSLVRDHSCDTGRTTDFARIVNYRVASQGLLNDLWSSLFTIGKVRSRMCRCS